MVTTQLLSTVFARWLTGLKCPVGACVCWLLQEIVGPSALVMAGSPAAQISGQIEHESRLGTINTFGGGVNEIQREIVSMAGLRMPRVPR